MNLSLPPILLITLWTLTSMVNGEPESKSPPYPTIGEIERLDQRLDALIPPDAKIEVLAEGFAWSEGPAWSQKDNRLLFSDIPNNTIYQWEDTSGVSIFLKPAGYTREPPRGGELGSNGLAFDSQGRLLLCQHGDRRLARLESPGQYITLADSYREQRLNSPNDLVIHSNGDVYFTDPPYGLEGLNQDPEKELDFNGVYRLTREGRLTLLTEELSFPNGIGFSPDEQTLYVANSDPERAVWMAFPVRSDGTLDEGEIFFDATSRVGQAKGLPDGLAVDEHGNLFATGPGGVLVFNADGDHLGTVRTGEATANCAWGEDGSTLYITADRYLCRITTHTQGLRF